MDTFDGCFYREYVGRLQAAADIAPTEPIGQLATALFAAVQHRRHVFLAGNGGSAANAAHLANDFLYGIGKSMGAGIKVEALSANASVLTCLANDLSYEEVFAEQLRLKAEAGDMLIVLSGSGNSPNVVRALEAARLIGMQTFAILGYSGGRCRELAEVPIHFAVDDMQIAEDMQLMVGHVCMQWVHKQLKATLGVAQ